LSQVLDLDDAGVEFSLTGEKDLVRFSRAVIKQAILRRASDIHMHPFAGGGVVRYRIDGQLERIATISKLDCQYQQRSASGYSRTAAPRNFRVTQRP